MRTKKEEIDMLERWFNEAQAEPESLMAMFLNVDMFHCVRGHLRANADTDIYAKFVADRQQLLSRPSPAEVEVLRTQLKEMAEEYDRLNTLAGSLNVRIGELNGRISFEVANNTKFLCELADVKSNWQADHDKLIAQNGTLRMQISDIEAEREAEVNRLKARLWDMHEAQEETT